ncbi:MAG: hypothetical protein EHM58_08920 [Ignavibacteriae bacterium]|nr:MAG: hypothetical protein EHM58_08920 [Ignavibacteriota bacterium]
MKTFSALLIILSAFIFLSCSKSPEKEIQGKWKYTGTGAIFEFMKDREMKLILTYGIIPGKYTFPAKDSIKMEFTGSSPEGVKIPDIYGNAVIRGDSMFIIYDESGIEQLMRFVRVE